MKKNITLNHLQKNIETLLLNFTHNSDEADVFKKKYFKWKENLPKNIIDIIDKENGEDKEKMIIIIEDDTQKKIIFNVLIIESLIKKDKNLKSFVDKLRNKFPLIDEIKKDKK